ncbi:Acetyltransferase (GNAT) family protein [Duganella sp. CF458]|uniref:GNAT family N-acetyltransferase n=1 Tax=Duganella sp. CF458 TaxID=1884368 RepID=UPI0008E5B689|nr:GNAT family N-acetyltransferase [Duganella sp. CF458]SFG45274.1 Acetyltransferase (GNAT) family protein [Duganella sp. CF458]
MELTLRSEAAADQAFLRALFGAVRVRELGLAGMDEAVLQPLLDMQCAAQRQSYRQAFPGARFEIIEADGVPAGRRVVAQSGGALHLVDIALMPAWCGKGIGSTQLRGLQHEAAGAGLPLRLHVALNNRAEALYRRLGFKEIGVSGMHRAMEWENDNE